MTEKEFNSRLMAPAQLSLATSKIAIEKIQNSSAKEFAGFELAETTAITTVLKSIGVLAPEMDEESKSIFSKIESAVLGPEFDKLYIESQLKNHQLLRDLTEDYLNEAPSGNLDQEESQGKYLATLALTMFNEHVTITERISKELQGD